MKNNKYFKFSILSIITIVLIFLDQLSKYLVMEKLNLTKNYPIVHNLFSFEYLENRGVAFGFMSGKMTLITIIVVVVSIFISYMIYLLEKAIINNKKIFIKFTLLQIICSFLIAGAIGNLIDRIRLGYVVDFIKFDFINFPTFNVADCYVTASAVILFIMLMFFISEEELESVKNKK